jgi:hypothetical protein
MDGPPYLESDINKLIFYGLKEADMREQQSYDYRSDNDTYEKGYEMPVFRHSNT